MRDNTVPRQTPGGLRSSPGSTRSGTGRSIRRACPGSASRRACRWSWGQANLFEEVPVRLRADPKTELVDPGDVDHAVIDLDRRPFRGVQLGELADRGFLLPGREVL